MIKTPKLTPDQIKSLDPTSPPVVDVFNNGQSFFSNMKIHYCDVHPVKSWVVFADKRGSVYLFDYIQNDLLHTFSLNSMFESKKEETNLYKTLDKNFKNVQLPYWYDEELLSSKTEKFGDLKSVKFYDEHVQYWKLRQLNNMTGSDSIQNVQSPVMRVGGGVDDDDESRSRMVGVNGAVGYSNNADRPPKCIVLHTESRIIMLRYDEVSSLLFFFDDVKSSQLDGKSIICFDFLYKQSIVALGCSDGSIRFWDFQQRKVLNKIIPNAHSKGLSQLITVPRDDPLSRYPGIVTTSSDGSLALWNLDTEKAEYTEAKCQGGGIASMIIDTNSGYLVTSGIDKSIAVRSLSSGKIIKQTKTKVPMKNLSIVSTCNCSPSWLLMLENKKQKRQIFRMPTHLNFEPTFVDNNIIDVSSYAPQTNKDPKFYIIQQHPLQQDLIFIGSSFGLLLAKMSYNRKPTVCSGFLRAEALLGQSSEPEMPSFDTPIDDGTKGASQLVNGQHEKKKYCIYVREKNVYQRYVETNSEGKKEFSSEKVVFNMGKVSNVKLDVSYSGRYVSLLWESEREYFVFDISKDTWKNVASERECSNIVWSSSSDTFAILKGNFTSKKVSVKKIENSSVKLVCENVSINGGSIDDIYGGVLLGVKYSNFTEESGFQLYNWNGADAFGSTTTEPYLPKPQFVVWDNLSGKCLMGYQDSYAIFNSKPSFKMEYYVEEKIQTAFWWNSTLFIATESEIKCVFVTTGKIFSTVLASTDVAFYSQISQKTPLDEQSSLDPIPLPKPKGDLSFMDVVGDNLYVIDSLSQIHTINNISLTPSIKFRMLVAAGLTRKAMEWIPFIAQEIHDYLADFLCAFGYTKEACSIDSLSSYKRLQLCFEHEHIKYGMDGLTYLDENRFFFRHDNARSSSKKEEDNLELSRLFVRLGSVGEKKLNKMVNSHQSPLHGGSTHNNNHFIPDTTTTAGAGATTNGSEDDGSSELSVEEVLQIIEQSYRRAAELEPSTYSHLIIFSAKHFPEKLPDLRSEIHSKMETSCEDDHVMFNQSLTMLALVSKDFGLASSLFQQSGKWSQAATLDNSKVDAWNSFLNSKPNSLPVNIGN